MDFYLGPIIAKPRQAPGGQPGGDWRDRVTLIETASLAGAITLNHQRGVHLAGSRRNAPTLRVSNPLQCSQATGGVKALGESK